LILQVTKIAGAGEVRGVEPLVHRRAAALKLGADRVLRQWRIRDARLSRSEAGSFLLASRTATAMLPAAEARRRGLKIKFVRRMGDDYPRAILHLVGFVNVNAIW
jgi:L-iditol 2-dehydrogenase